jgi:hypothetical protein
MEVGDGRARARAAVRARGGDELRGYLLYLEEQARRCSRPGSRARRPRARSRSTTTRRGATPSGSP